MEVNLKLKHLIIPLIVFLISFISVTNNFRIAIMNPTFDVGYLYNYTNLYDETDELLLLNDITNYANNESNLSNLNLETSSFNNINISKLKELSNRSELIIISNTEITEELVKFFNENSNTYFVLYNCKNDKVLPDNVVTISLDYSKVVEDAAINLSDDSVTNKYLYVTTDKFVDDYSTFEDIVKSEFESSEVFIYNINDVDNNTVIRSDIDDYLENGVDSIYIADPRVNDIVISTVLNIQHEIITNQSELQIDQADDKITNEEDDNSSQSQEDKNTSQSDEDDNTSQSEEDTVEDLKYKQEKINIVNNSYNYKNNGMYFDENKNGLFDNDDLSVVKNSYIFDVSNAINAIDTMIQEDTFIHKDFDILPTKE